MLKQLSDMLWRRKKEKIKARNIETFFQVKFRGWLAPYTYIE